MTTSRINLARRAVLPQSGTGAGGQSTTPLPHARTAESPFRGDAAVGVHAHATHASQVEDFTQRLKSLSPKDRKAVLDSLLLEAQLNDDTSATRDVAMWSEAVHREATRRLGSADGGLVGPAIVRRLVAVGTSWKPVQQFMQSSKLAELNVTERQRAYYLLAELLVRHALVVARRSGAPFSVKLVAQCTNNLPGVFEDAFPGYLEAGLARMVARHAEHVA